MNRWRAAVLFLILLVSTGSAQPAVYPNPVVRAYLVAMSPSALKSLGVTSSASSCELAISDGFLFNTMQFLESQGEAMILEELDNLGAPNSEKILTFEQADARVTCTDWVVQVGTKTETTSEKMRTRKHRSIFAFHLGQSEPAGGRSMKEDLWIFIEVIPTE